MRIGIIDSGFDPNFFINNEIYISNKANFVYSQTNEQVLQETVNSVYEVLDIDKHKNNEIDYHGSMVLSEIWKCNKFAKYIIADLIEFNENSSIFCLLEAFRWLIEEAPDVINISLAIDGLTFFNNFETLANKAAEKGIIVFSACTNQICVPAMNTNIIAISSKEYWFNQIVSGDMQNKVSMILPNNKTTVWNGNRWSKVTMSASLACAFVTAISSQYGEYDTNLIKSKIFEKK